MFCNPINGKCQYDQIIGRTIRTLLFFIVFYLYMYLKIEPYLLFHGVREYTEFPIFYIGWNFFHKFTSYPGGIIEYFSSFLAQFFYFNWAGALIVTLLAWSLFVCTDNIIKAVKTPILRCIRFIPPILLLIIYSQYMHFFVTTIALLTALLFINVHIQITRKNKLVVPIILVESLVLYYLAGGAYLLFAVLSVIYEFIFKRRWKTGLVSLAFGIGIPYFIGVSILNVSIIDAFSNLLPFSWKISLGAEHSRMAMVVNILYLFIPLTTLSVGLWKFCFKRNNISSVKLQESTTGFNQRKAKVKEGLHKKLFSRHGNVSIVQWFIQPLILFGITIAILFFYNDPKSKPLLKVDYYLSNNMWKDTLEITNRYPDENLMIHAADLALYHTGRLGYDLFKYHRNLYPSLFAMLLSSQQYEPMLWKKANIFFCLGLINESERYFVEALLHFGEHPYIIQRLALVNIIKGKPDTARIYLNRLAKTIFYSDWANDYLARLKSDPHLSSDLNIIQRRNLIMKKDRFGAGIKIQLLGLLEDRKNHMVFEYTMSFYLLEKRCDKIVENLYRLKDYQYSEIPRLYEEAVLVYEYLTKTKVDLHGYQISKVTQQRFKDFLEIEKIYEGNRKLVSKELLKNYNNSFFLYYSK